MQFINARLLVSNIQASIHFWRDVMGFSMTFGDEAIGYAYFETGRAGIELMTRDAFAAALGKAAALPSPGEHPAVFVFRVDDVETAYARFVERGAVAVAAPQERPAWQAYSAHISDPDGYIVEIYRPLSQPNASAS